MSPIEELQSAIAQLTDRVVKVEAKTAYLRGQVAKVEAQTAYLWGQIDLLYQTHSTDIGSAMLKSHLTKFAAVMWSFQAAGGCPTEWQIEEYTKLEIFWQYLISTRGKGYKVTRADAIQCMKWILAPSSQAAPSKNYSPSWTQAQIISDRERLFRLYKSTMVAAENYHKARHPPPSIIHLPNHPKGQVQNYIYNHFQKVVSCCNQVAHEVTQKEVWYWLEKYQGSDKDDLKALYSYVFFTDGFTPPDGPGGLLTDATSFDGISDILGPDSELEEEISVDQLVDAFECL